MSMSDGLKKVLENLKLDEQVGEKTSEMLGDFAAELQKRISEMAWQICNDYVEYSHYEPLNNWKDRARSELIEEQLWRKTGDNDYWGKVMRRTILKEHRDELLPLLANEYTKQLEEELERVKKLYEFEVRLNQSRPSY